MLKQQIQKDIQNYLKQSNEIARSTLSMLLAAITNKEKEKRYKLAKDKPNLSEEESQKISGLNDEEVAGVIMSEAKKRREAADIFEKGGRKEMADKEREELVVLEQYLPEQMSDEELIEIVKRAIEKTGAKETKDMGKVMAEVAPQVKGKADGSRISQKVKEILSAN